MGVSETGIRQKILDGVPLPPWGHWDESSVMASLTGIFTYLGDPVSYEDLMGISGQAFRIQVHESGLCPSSPHANCGFDCITPVTEAMGYERRSFLIDETDPSSKETVRNAVIGSIDRGIPVIHQPEEAEIIVGYLDGGASFLRRQWQNTDANYTALEGVRWGVDVLTKIRPRREEKSMAVEALERILLLAGSGSVRGYWTGFRAYEQWMAWLRENGRKENLLGNGWIYCSLKSARKAGSAYLRKISGFFEEKVSRQIAAAADAYRAVEERLGIPFEIAPGPWGIKEEEWTMVKRERQAAILDEVLSLEEAAVEEVRNAVRMIKGD